MDRARYTHHKNYWKLNSTSYRNIPNTFIWNMLAKKHFAPPNSAIRVNRRLSDHCPKNERIFFLHSTRWINWALLHILFHKIKEMKLFKTCLLNDTPCCSIPVSQKDSIIHSLLQLRHSDFLLAVWWLKFLPFLTCQPCSTLASEYVTSSSCWGLLLNNIRQGPLDVYTT